MDTQTWAEIRRLKMVDGLPEREIAVRLNISRGKVRRALAAPDGPTQRKLQQRISKLDAFESMIDEMLETYPKLTGLRVYEKLKTHGYTGGITIVRDYLTQIRGMKREAYVRYETAPGEEAQVDWGYHTALPFGINLDGSPCLRKIYFFVMVLSYSRKIYVEFTPSQSLDNFLQCHLNAFKHFGGVPKNILYDNLKSVVISRYIKHIQFNKKFMEFAGYYLFNPQPCNVGKGNEKGKVESGVGYVKKNFLAGRNFEDLFDLEFQSKDWMKRVDQRKHGTTGEIPEERFQKEKEYLIPLQPKDYDTTIPVQVKAYHDCRLRFDCNFYSVPSKYILLPLLLRADKYYVKIWHRDRCIASHKRNYGKNQKIDDPKHFEDLLKIKKAARDSKLRDRFLTMAPSCAKYFEGLVQLDKDLKSELRQIMGQVDLYGIYEVIPAIEKALEYKAFGAVYIKNIIAQNRAKRHANLVMPLNLSKYPEIENLEVEHKSLDGYDKLFPDLDQREVN